MANEKRLIDANALIDWMTKPTGFRCNCDDCPDTDCLHCIVEDCIKNAPTVDAAEVVHGRNETKQHPVDEFICSVCGYVCQDTHKYVYDEDAEDWSMYEFEFKYCPNCGAKMDGGADNG
jgi:hypothetical protein